MLAFPLMGFTPIFSNHDSTEKIDKEFRNVVADLQSQEFTIYTQTPTLSTLKDGQIVIVASGTWNTIMFRRNQEIYKVNASCVTVSR